MRRSLSRGLWQFSQEMIVDVVTKAGQFLWELNAELQRFSWSYDHAFRALSSSSAQNMNRGAKGGEAETTSTTIAIKKHDHKQRDGEFQGIRSRTL
ncbi:hypothetical protein SESBI_05621 [Sesbania bispinosa]|nr:hypothetical protein SESBI_05621 [Sesbania bispinosa]